MTKIQVARKEQAAEIASLIMLAMTYESCQWFAGPHHTLEDFHALMTRLVEREDSQYSYLNTLVAMEDDKVAGICTSYDGALLLPLRRAFIEEAFKAFGIDYNGFDEETQAGELYLDSLAVFPEYRGKGIATRLIEATKQKGKEMGLPVGLLVNKENPNAEKLYRSLGFDFANDTTWAGHDMRHLIWNHHAKDS